MIKNDNKRKSAENIIIPKVEKPENNINKTKRIIEENSFTEKTKTSGDMKVGIRFEEKDNESSAAVAGGDGIIREDARAIAEAKAAYMPNKDEVPAWEEEDEVLFETHPSFGILECWYHDLIGIIVVIRTF